MKIQKQENRPAVAQTSIQAPASTQKSNPLKAIQEKIADAFEAKRSRAAHPRAQDAASAPAKSQAPVLDVATNLLRLMQGAPPAPAPKSDLSTLKQYGAEAVLDNEAFANKMLDRFPNDTEYMQFQENLIGVIQHRIETELSNKHFASDEQAADAALDIAAQVMREASTNPDAFTGLAATGSQLAEMKEVAAGLILDNEAFAEHFLDKMDEAQYERFLNDLLERLDQRIHAELGGRVFPNQDAALEAASDIAAAISRESRS